MFTIKIADLPIAIDNRYDWVFRMARDYLTDEEPVFTVSVSDEEIEAERRASNTDYPSAYYESIVAYRHIAEKMPEYNAFVFHGAIMENADVAYAITANSGVGKTTHVSLWLTEFSDIKILNGDKPLIRFIDGAPYVYGTPWQGKENYGHNGKKPLSAIVFLRRGEKNTAEKISPADAVMDFMTQIYLPKKSPVTLSKTMSLANKLIGGVKLVRLYCNMDPEAAHVCRAALEGGTDK